MMCCDVSWCCRWSLQHSVCVCVWHEQWWSPHITQRNSVSVCFSSSPRVLQQPVALTAFPLSCQLHCECSWWVDVKTGVPASADWRLWRRQRRGPWRRRGSTETTGMFQHYLFIQWWWHSVADCSPDRVFMSQLIFVSCQDLLFCLCDCSVKVLWKIFCFYFPNVLLVIYF